MANSRLRPAGVGVGVEEEEIEETGKRTGGETHSLQRASLKIEKRQALTPDEVRRQ